jgi:polysaccharide pyruvyl transferase WcaK-like protein
MKTNSPNGVFLYGYFGAGNLGDDLLLAVTIGALHPMLPHARFFVRDHGDTAELSALDQGITFTGIETILADQSVSRVVRLARYLSAYARAFRECQWLVFAGGTLFHERGTLTALVLQWMICVLARLQRVRIAALGVGVAELHSGTARWLLRRIVAMSELFLVRDDAALRQCAGTKARLTSDLVFAWDALKPVAPTAGNHARIGLTIYPPACRGPVGKQARAALVDAIRSWQAAGHTVVYLICQRDGPAVGDDTIFTQLSAELGSGSPKIETRVLTTDAAIIAHQIGDLTVICGMRFHALVLAAMLGRPFLGLAHDNKISEICRTFAMPCYSVEELAGEKLVAATAAIKDRIPDSLLVQRARHLAQENFRAFAALTS